MKHFYNTYFIHFYNTSYIFITLHTILLIIHFHYNTHHSKTSRKLLVSSSWFWTSMDFFSSSITLNTSCQHQLFQTILVLSLNVLKEPGTCQRQVEDSLSRCQVNNKPQINRYFLNEVKIILKDRVLKIISCEIVQGHNHIRLLKISLVTYQWELILYNQQ